MIKLSAKGWSNNFFNLSQFEFIVELNLSSNNLTTLSSIGIEKLKGLIILDASFNQIQDSSHEIARLVESVSSLQVLCIQGNPCMGNDPVKVRKEILYAIPRLIDEKCNIKVTEIWFTF